MDSFINTIEKYNMLRQNDSVIIALSGGADSVTLLHLMSDLKPKLMLSLRAVHVNHGLRGEESDRDEAFVKLLCEKLEICLDVIHVDAKMEANRLGISVEDAGRRLRYLAFEEIREKNGYSKIAVAHNKNDDAETILMWILRGAGLKGLCGIPAVRGYVIRPLLGTSREEIEDYCVTENIEYRTDRSNFENIYKRNKLRLELIPTLRREYNPGIVNALTRMSETLAKDNDYMETQALQAYEECLLPQALSGEIRLAIDKLKSCHEAIAVRIVKIAAINLGADLKDLYLTHYESILGLTAKPSGKRVFLPHGLYSLTEYNSLIIGIGFKETQIPEVGVVLTPEVPVYIKEFDFTAVLSHDINFLKSSDFSAEICTKVFSYDKMYGVIEIRNRRPGDRIYVASMGGNKKIKDYFSDIKLSPSLRDKVPLAACGSDVLWIMDKKNIMSDRYKAEEDRPQVYIHILRKKPDSTRGAEKNDREKCNS